MNKYELALVVTAKLEDAARAAVVEKAKGYIMRANGEILGIEEWGRKRLAYEIQYQREAYYYFIHFEAEPTAPAAIERDVRIMDNVLRYLIVRHDDDFVMPEIPEKPAEEETEAAVETPADASEAAEGAAAESAPAEAAADESEEPATDEAEEPAAAETEEPAADEAETEEAEAESDSEADDEPAAEEEKPADESEGGIE